MTNRERIAKLDTELADAWSRRQATRCARIASDAVALCASLADELERERATRDAALTDLRARCKAKMLEHAELIRLDTDRSPEAAACWLTLAHAADLIAYVSLGCDARHPESEWTRCALPPGHEGEHSLMPAEPKEPT